jgi:hypothetical protein
MISAFPMGLEGYLKKILGRPELGGSEIGFSLSKVGLGFFSKDRGIFGEFGTKQVQVLPPGDKMRRGKNRHELKIKLMGFNRQASLESVYCG